MDALPSVSIPALPLTAVSGTAAGGDVNDRSVVGYGTEYPDTACSGYDTGFQSVCRGLWYLVQTPCTFPTEERRHLDPAACSAGVQWSKAMLRKHKTPRPGHPRRGVLSPPT